MSDQTHPSDPAHLCVPVHLDCLVVNQRMARSSGQVEGTNFSHWNRTVPQYAHLNTFDNPWPVLDQTSSVPDLGVHLHWALPDALTRAREDVHGDGKLTFPHVPNRWLVMRSCTNRPELLKAWVVHSDYVSDEGASNFINPWTGHLDKPVATKMGAIHAITPPADGAGDWDGMAPEPAAQGAAFLNAIGPGELTFAAWQPGLDGVFSLVDDMQWVNPANQTPELIETGDLQYSVFGWYSNLALDPITTDAGAPLDPAALTEILERYNWALTSQTIVPPTRTICHATRLNVNWQQIDLPKRPNAGTDDWTSNIQVAVGNTAIDGLAALLQARGKDAKTSTQVAEFFEAVQYGKLDDYDSPGGHVRLDHTARDHWFSAHSGGVHWDIVPRPREDDHDAAPPPIGEASVIWLAELNKAQRKLDREARVLKTMQAELYDWWWKAERSKTETPEFRRDVDVLLAQQLEATKAQIATVEELSKAVPDLGRAYAKAIADEAKQDSAQVDHVGNAIADWVVEAGKTLPNTYQLKPSAAARFWAPNDPVVVVTGLNRANKHGEDGIYRDDGKMLCRLSADLLTSIPSLPAASPLDLSAAVIPKHAAMPDMSALVTEAFLMVPENIQADADLKAAFTASARRMDGAASLPSEMCAPSQVALQTWKQAWVPLFLEWKVSFYPTVSDEMLYLKTDMSKWKFSAMSRGHRSSGGVDHRFIGDGSDAPQDLGQSITLSGRTFLTPQAEYKFAAEIKKHIDAHAPDTGQTGKVGSFLDQVKNLDVLSQSLGGFHQRLLQRAAHASLKPGGDVAAAIGTAFDHPPAIEALGSETEAALEPYFNPVRAGYFHFEELQMVDCYGQSVNLIHANMNAQKDAANFTPFLGRGMRPEKQMEKIANAENGEVSNRSLIELPPRIVQPARLNFRLIDGASLPDPNSADPCLEEVGLNPNASPVCGWVIPNHLDKALLIYTNTGDLLGELILRTATRRGAGGEAQKSHNVDWVPRIGATSQGPDVEAIENPYLQGFIKGILDAPTEDAKVPAFAALLTSIDASLWTVDPLGNRADQNLSVLIGRPLALVRARLHLELDGHAKVDQSWGYDGLGDRPEAQTDPKMKTLFTQALVGGVKDMEFGVKLGEPELRNDGLMGYFEDEAFNVFHSAVPIEGAEDHAYLSPIRDDHYLKLDLGEDTVKRVTLLMDPRAVVHASTGILPVKSLRLPDAYVDKALSGLEMTFRAGPVLSDPDDIEMPKPAEQNGTWNWIEKDASGAMQVDPIMPARIESVLSPHNPVLREGFLHLSLAEVTLHYDVTLTANADGTAVLEVTAQNRGKVPASLDGITIVVPHGEGPTAMVRSLEGATFDCGAPADWSPQAGGAWPQSLPDGHRVFAKFEGGQVAANQKAVFSLDALTLSGGAGTTSVFIAEHSHSNPTRTIPVAKPKL